VQDCNRQRRREPEGRKQVLWCRLFPGASSARQPRAQVNPLGAMARLRAWISGLIVLWRNTGGPCTTGATVA
jgi:hypothetical protein